MALIEYEWIEEPTPYSAFTSTLLYTLLETYFSKINHTHDMSNEHTHNASSILDLTSHFVDDLQDNTDRNQQVINSRMYYALQGKQPTIPPLSLIETKTGHGVTGKVYSDGLMVHITLNGTATSISGTTTLFTFTETDYMPDTNTIIPVPRAGSGSTVRLATSGNVLFYPSNLNNSPIVEGTFTFPLKSRLPSEE